MVFTSSPMVSLQSVPLKFSKYAISCEPSLSYISRAHLGHTPPFLSSGYLLINLIYFLNDSLKLRLGILPLKIPLSPTGLIKFS